MRNCVYCSSEILDKRAMQICDRCGEKVWGKKMFDAIKKATDDAEERGDLALYKEQEASLERKKSV
jgi:DNA-directed RNA polymerase subunit RPC12/RpoP